MAKSRESAEKKTVKKSTAPSKKAASKANGKAASKNTGEKKAAAAKTKTESNAKKSTTKKAAVTKTSKDAEPKKTASKTATTKKTAVTKTKRKDDVSRQIEESNHEIYALLQNNSQSNLYDQQPVNNPQEDAKKKRIRNIASASAVLIAIIFGLIFLIRGCVNSSKSQNKERQNIIRLAEKYMEKEQYDSAMDLLNTLLIQDPEDKEVNELLDKLIELKAAQERANAANFTVINGQTGPGSYDINIDTSAFKETFDSMSRELTAANEANAKNQEQLNRLLEAQRQEEKERQAQAQALEQQKKAEEVKRKAEEEELAKQNKKVQAEIQKVNELIQQGNSKLNAGNQQDALKKYKEAVACLPISQGEPKFSGAKYAEIASNLYEAAEREKIPDAKAVLMQNAVTYAQKAVEKDPANAKAHFILAMNAENSKDAATAENELELAVKNDPNNYLYYYYLGRRQQINKKYSQARSSYTSSIKLNPSSSETEKDIHASSYFNLGLTCNRLSLPKDALAAFRKAYGINPQHAKAYLEEARLLRKSFNDLDGSINAYNKVLNIEPDNMSALKECGSAYAEAGNYAKAENCFRRVIAKLGTTQDPMTYYNLSTVLYNQAKVTDALKYALEAYNTKDVFKASAEKAMIVYQYALCTEKSGDKTTAISLYKEVLTLNPSHTKAKINLGIMFMEMVPPDVDTALSFLTGAYQEDKTNFEVNNNIGNAYLLKKDYTNAVNYYLNASKIKPKDTEVKINLAKAYTEFGDFDSAKIIYVEVINQNPNSYDAYIDLAKVCIALKDTISAEGYLTALQNKKPEYRTSEVKALLDTVRPKN